MKVAQFKVGDQVMVYGFKYRIVKDRKHKHDRPNVPGPYGGNYRIGVTVANEPGADRMHWTIIKASP